MSLALTKTEVAFRSRRRNMEPVRVWIGSILVSSSPAMKYLGLWVDDRWSFAHFRQVADKARKVAGALSGLMPNLRGPRLRMRQLYAGVVNSVILYGAPIWYREVAVRGRCRLLAQVQRIVAIQTICAYRTVSTDAARVLARMLPVDILARQWTVFWSSRQQRKRGNCLAAINLGPLEELPTLRTSREQRPPGTQEDRSPFPDIVKRVRRESLEEWRARLQDPRYAGRRIREAFALVLDLWMQCRGATLTFRATQVITGHGVFGVYLYRI